MDNSNKNDFAKLIYTTGELYDKKISKDLLLMYFNILIKYSIGQVNQGVSNHALDPKHGTFFPKPADIVRNIDGASRTPEDRALIAWMEVERSIATVGSYGTLKLEDKQAMMAIKAIGSWQQLCATDREKLAFRRQEFIANYRALENTPVDMLPESLEGRADLENQRNMIGGVASDLLIELDERNKLR